MTLHQAANMTMDELRSFVQESKWTFAKTMPQTPHEYTLRRDAKDEALFERVVIYIRQVGLPTEVGQQHLHAPRHRRLAILHDGIAAGSNNLDQSGTILK